MECCAPEQLDPKEAVLRYLIELPAVFVPHSGETLFQHLLGTYRVLKSWTCSEDLCVAGLFHSIYGTPAYRPGPLPVSRRGELQRAIGMRAEALVHGFSQADWSCLLAEGEPILAAQSRDLLTLAAANFVEQWPRVMQLSGGDFRIRESLARSAALLPHLGPLPARSLALELSSLWGKP